MSEPGKMIVRAAADGDIEEICGIYNHYVERTHITFEEQPVGNDVMRSRVAGVVGHLPWLVCLSRGKVIGYAYGSRWKERSAYRFSVESTVYVANDSVGRGVGRALYQVLLKELAKHGCHTILAGIALPNEASVAFHERFGFTKAAHLSEVGSKFGRWIDVGYWQWLPSRFERQEAKH